MRSWYAAYTNPRSEKKVSKRLEDEGFEVYCPMVKELSVWSDRKKWIQKPVLPSYVFVNIIDRDITNVRRVPGIVNFVYWLGKPAVVRDEDIHKLKKFIEHFPDASIMGNHPFEAGDEVILQYGPLRGVSGIILNTSKNKAKVTIESLSLEMIANVHLDELKLANGKKTI